VQIGRRKGVVEVPVVMIWKVVALWGVTPCLWQVCIGVSEDPAFSILRIDSGEVYVLQ
jgi:Protease II